MKKYTAPPWTTARNSSNGWIRISGPDGQPVANVKTWANAHLIAAVHDLLAALQAAVASGIIDHNGEPEAARAAIAKATGVTL